MTKKCTFDIMPFSSLRRATVFMRLTLIPDRTSSCQNSKHIRLSKYIIKSKLKNEQKLIWNEDESYILMLVILQDLDMYDTKSWWCRGRGVGRKGLKNWGGRNHYFLVVKPYNAATCRQNIKITAKYITLCTLHVYQKHSKDEQSSMQKFRCL